MRYFNKREYGTILRIPEESELYDYVKYSPQGIPCVVSALYNVGILEPPDTKVQLNLYIRDTGENLDFLFPNEDYAQKMGTQNAINLLAKHAYTDDSQWEDLDEEDLIDMEEIKDEEYEDYDEDDIPEEYLDVIDSFASDLYQLIEAILQGAIPEETQNNALAIKDKVEKVPECNIYQVSASEAVDFMDYAECLWEYGGHLFLQAKDGYLLDDFLHKGNPNAVKGERINVRKEETTT